MYSHIIISYPYIIILYDYIIILLSSYYIFVLLYSIIILLYYHIIIIIRHRAFRHEKRVRSTPLVSQRSSQIWSCQFFCFKDSAGPGCNSLRDPFSDNLALFFRSTFLLQRSAPKKLPRDPPKHTKISKICKKSGLRTHPRPSNAKKLRLEGVKL